MTNVVKQGKDLDWYWFFILSLLVLSIGACSDKDTKATQGTQVAIPLGNLLTSQAINFARVSGEVVINGDGNNAYTMTRIGTSSTFQATNVPLQKNTVYQVEVRFTYQQEKFRNTPIPVAYGGVTQDIGEQSTLTISLSTAANGGPQSDPTYLDSDGDNISNLDEIDNGTDPENNDTQIPVLTLSPDPTATYSGSVDISLHCDDASPCTIRYGYADAYGNPPTNYYALNNVDLTDTLNTTATLYYYAVDAAGNQTATAQATYNVQDPSNIVSGTVRLPDGSGGMQVIANAQVTLNLNGSSSNPISSAVTDSNGFYSINIPASYPSPIPGNSAQYYVAATFGAGNEFRARVHANSTDIDHISDAYDRLIQNYASPNLSALSIEESKFLLQKVSLLKGYVKDNPTAAEASDQLLQGALHLDYERVAENMQAGNDTTATICGDVTNSINGAEAGIDIVVRGFNDRLLKNMAVTDANGHYCLNLMNGDYYIGAINRKAPQIAGQAMAASAWWSSSGLKQFSLDAQKITMSNGTPSVATVDFSLPTGVHINGSVQSQINPSRPLANINIIIREIDAFYPVASTTTTATGIFHITVAPGKYIIEAENQTAQPYASAFYGTNKDNMNFATINDCSNATQPCINKYITLIPGVLLTGQVFQDAISPRQAIAGSRVIIDLASGGPAHRVLGDLAGRYRIWLTPAANFTPATNAPYTLYGNGIRFSPDISSPNPVDNAIYQDFTVATRNWRFNVIDNQALAASRVKVRLFENGVDGAGNPTWTYMGNASSDAEGNAYLLLNPLKRYSIIQRIDWDRSAGGNVTLSPLASTVHSNALALRDATAIDPTLTISNISLSQPSGIFIKGKVLNGTTPVANAQIRFMIDLTAWPDSRYVATRSRADGGFSLGVLSGAYSRIQTIVPGSTTTAINCDSILLTGSGILSIDVSTGTCAIALN